MPGAQAQSDQATSDEHRKPQRSKGENESLVFFGPTGLISTSLNKLAHCGSAASLKSQKSHASSNDRSKGSPGAHSRQALSKSPAEDVAGRRSPAVAGSAVNSARALRVAAQGGSASAPKRTVRSPRPPPGPPSQRPQLHSKIAKGVEDGSAGNPGAMTLLPREDGKPVEIATCGGSAAKTPRRGRSLRKVKL
jgi:hypothetical protein